MKITASIVTYNNEETIRKCLDSIKIQIEGLDFKLYVIDNGSMDSTMEIVKDYDFAELIRSFDNVGFGKGHNRVLPLLNSDVHFVINPDVVVNEPVFSELAESLSTHEDAVMATPMILNPDGSEQKLPKLRPTLRYLLVSKLPLFHHYRDAYTRSSETFTHAEPIDFCTGCFFAIKTEAFKELKGFADEYFMYFEDADLTRRAQKLGTVYFIPNVHVIHHWQRANMKSISGIIRYFKSMFQFFQKWGWRF